VLRLDHTNYPLCLLDTNAASTLVKNRDRECKHYLEWSMSTPPMFLPTFSLFTVLELRQSPAVYEAFKEVFSVIPCVFVKSFDQLIEEEVRCYPDPSAIDPCLLAFAGPLAEAGLSEVLDTYFQSVEGLALEREWNEGRPDVVDGIASLVSNYLPEGETYTPKELRAFIQIAGYSQIAMRHLDFAQDAARKEQEVDIDAFPSVKAVAFTVFYKFYADKERRSSVSDAYDIIISSATPYVEAVITENHQAEALRKMKRRDDFLNGLSVFSIRDFRGGPPA
jgi:hypothetical protein